MKNTSRKTTAQRKPVHKRARAASISETVGSRPAPSQPVQAFAPSVMTYFGDRMLAVSLDPSEEYAELVGHVQAIAQSHDAILRCVRLVMEAREDVGDEFLSEPFDLLRNAMVGAEFLSSFANGMLARADERRAVAIMSASHE